MENIIRDRIQISINDRRTVHAQAGISLLQALKDENIFVPSACGGRGICGLCRLRVLEGAPEQLTPQERAHLGGAEQQDNFRLACQIQVKKNLRISIPEGNHFFRPEYSSHRRSRFLRGQRLVVPAGTS